MKIAVIKTGGKQYLVAEKDKLKIEKLAGEPGASLEFKDVLLVVDGEKVETGKPTLGNVKVTAKVLKQARAPKVEVVKYKSKIRYRRRLGHRQQYTEVQIEKIS